MCERTKTAIDMLKQRKSNLTKGEIIMVFEKMIEDNQKLGERMTEVEKRLTTLENKTDKILTILERPSLWEKVFLGEYARYAWIFLIVALLILGGLLGVPTTGFNGILNIGG